MADTPACSLAPRLPAAVAPAAGAACGLVLLTLLVVDLPSMVRFPLLVAFMACAWRLARQLARAASPRRLEWSPDGRWTVDGRPARLAGATRVYAGLVLLRFRERGVPACWVPRAAVPPADFRRLKARLRLERATAGREPAAGNP